MPWSWSRFGLHFPIGLVMGICDLAGALGVLGLFIVYEIDECNHIKDRAFIDVQGALGGLLALVLVRYFAARAGVDIPTL